VLFFLSPCFDFISIHSKKLVIGAIALFAANYTGGINNLNFLRTVYIKS
jgi:hypothetical protein